MKVLLISPPRFHEISTNIPKIVEKNIGFCPPLGLLYIAANIINKTNHYVKVLDTQVENMNYEDIKKMILHEQPDLIGIQTYTFSLIDAINVAKIAKKICSAKIAFGGPHVNIFPEETIVLDCADFLVLGEGEYAFLELIAALEGKGRFENLKGIYTKDGARIIRGLPPQFIEDLDSLPFPDRSLTPAHKYYSILSHRHPVTTMISSRGCPYKCIFCDRPHLGKKFRCRSAKNVVDEMEVCISKHGIKEIFFYDDTFTVNRERTLKICEEILRRGLFVAWDIRARVDTVDAEILLHLKKAGCRRIHYGIESGNVKILEILKKGISLDQVKDAFGLTRKLGIESLAYFMLGSPGETKKEIMDTINFAEKLDADYVHFSITTPFPGTELYRKGLSQGLYKKDYWQEFSANPTSKFKPDIWDEILTRNELSKLLKSANEGFYLRPRFILKQMRRLSSSKEMLQKIRLGLAMLFDKWLRKVIKSI